MLERVGKLQTCKALEEVNCYIERRNIGRLFSVGLRIISIAFKSFFQLLLLINLRCRKVC